MRVVGAFMTLNVDCYDVK